MVGIIGQTTNFKSYAQNKFYYTSQGSNLKNRSTLVHFSDKVEDLTDYIASQSLLLQLFATNGLLKSDTTLPVIEGSTLYLGNQPRYLSVIFL